MAEYKSEETLLLAPAEKVFKKLSNLEGLSEMLTNIPEEKVSDEHRQLLNDVKVTADTISFPAGPVGNLTLRLTRLVEPTLILLEAVDAPVPMSLALNIFPIDEVSCKAQVVIDLQIPAMLKPMVSGPLNKMTAQFAQMLRNIPFD